MGCIIVKDKRIISSGCNGPIEDSLVPDICNCHDGHPCGDMEAIHAEMNAIAFAAKEGLELNGSTIFITHSPCYHCAKLLKQAGIKSVIFWKDYKDTSPLTYLKKNDIEVSQYSGELQEYPDTDMQ